MIVNPLNIEGGPEKPYNQYGFPGVDHSTWMVVQYADQDLWFIAAKEPARGYWFRTGDRTDLRPEFLKEIPSSWCPTLPNAHFPTVEIWLESIRACCPDESGEVDQHPIIHRDGSDYYKIDGSLYMAAWRKGDYHEVDGKLVMVPDEWHLEDLRQSEIIYRLI